jgi:DNA invertase Pin-like site-specific DNA recombinase
MFLSLEPWEEPAAAKRPTEVLPEVLADGLLFSRRESVGVGEVKVALYARVSMAERQNPENQLLELRRWAAASGHEIVGEYVDLISSRDTRPKKEELLRMLRVGELDGVAFVALDRWGRTTQELIAEMEEFSKSGKSLISLKEGLDFSTASGRMMAQMFAVFANFERDRIRERIMAGLARARAQGKKLGRKKGSRDNRGGLIKEKVVTKESGDSSGGLDVDGI